MKLKLMIKLREALMNMNQQVQRTGSWVCILIEMLENEVGSVGRNVDLEWQCQNKDKRILEGMCKCAAILRDEKVN